HQHDLARVICGLEPISQPLNIAINSIAADLRAVVIEISQRQSFQDRYASDLQAALDAGESLLHDLHLRHHLHIHLILLSIRVLDRLQVIRTKIRQRRGSKPHSPQTPQSPAHCSESF
ncbi:hypothetical protein JOM56_014638, partial [Amanita muscaria]